MEKSKKDKLKELFTGICTSINSLKDVDYDKERRKMVNIIGGKKEDLANFVQELFPKLEIGEKLIYVGEIGRAVGVDVKERWERIYGEVNFLVTFTETLDAFLKGIQSENVDADMTDRILMGEKMAKLKDAVMRAPERIENRYNIKGTLDGIMKTLEDGMTKNRNNLEDDIKYDMHGIKEKMKETCEGFATAMFGCQQLEWCLDAVLNGHINKREASQEVMWKNFHAGMDPNKYKVPDMNGLVKKSEETGLYNYYRECVKNDKKDRKVKDDELLMWSVVTGMVDAQNILITVCGRNQMKRSVNEKFERLWEKINGKDENGNPWEGNNNSKKENYEEYFKTDIEKDMDTLGSELDGNDAERKGLIATLIGLSDAVKKSKLGDELATFVENLKQDLEKLDFAGVIKAMERIKLEHYKKLWENKQKKAKEDAQTIVRQTLYEMLKELTKGKDPKKTQECLKQVEPDIKSWENETVCSVNVTLEEVKNGGVLNKFRMGKFTGFFTSLLGKKERRVTASWCGEYAKLQT